MPPSFGASAGRVLRALLLTTLSVALDGCSDSSLPSFKLDAVAKGEGAVVRLFPKNSSVTGTVSFVQRGDKVGVTVLVQELLPGTHRIFIHEVGNCNSPNAASAGRVWSAPGATPGTRLGDLPQLLAGSEGNARLIVNVRGITVGGGGPTDVIGRSVVVHDGMDPDPRPEFGVVNDWLACGVIEHQ